METISSKKVKIFATNKMQDEAMRAIINHYHAHPTHWIDKDFLVYQKICNATEAQHLVDVLCAKNLITYNFETKSRVIRLTPAGRAYAEIQTDAIHDKRVENIKYVITTAIAIIALIKSFMPEISAVLAWLSSKLGL